MKIAENDIDADMPLVNLGVDSLSASELVYYFINYGIKVTNTELISGLSINDILSKYQENNISSGLSTKSKITKIETTDVICPGDPFIKKTEKEPINSTEKMPKLEQNPYKFTNYKAQKRSNKYSLLMIDTVFISLILTSFFAWKLKKKIFEVFN